MTSDQKAQSSHIGAHECMPLDRANILSLKPGDVVVLRVDHVPSSEFVDAVHSTWKACLADALIEFQVPMLVLGKGQSLSVLRKDAA